MRGASLVRLLPAWAFTLATTGLALRAADALPGLLTGTPRGVVRHESIEAAERALGAPILLPTLFPESLGWPPESILSSGRAVALRFPGRVPGVELTLVETASGAPVPDTLLAPARPFHAVPFDLAGKRATLVDISVPPEGTYQELTLALGARTVVMRFRGPTELFVRMAGTLEPPRAAGAVP